MSFAVDLRCTYENIHVDANTHTGNLGHYSKQKNHFTHTQTKTLIKLSGFLLSLSLTHTHIPTQTHVDTLFSERLESILF